jgi:mono/diheme cytochrome c family protein
VIDQIYSFLGSIGFDHPLHAVIVHMPIGLSMGAFLFALTALVIGKKHLEPTARHAALLAFIFVFPTILFGVLDWLHYFKGAMIGPIRIKIVLAIAVALVLGAVMFLGGRFKLGGLPMLLLYGLALVMMIGLGYFGAQLVYGGWSPRAGASAQAQSQAGEKLFVENCQACHPGGGNIMSAELSLKKSKQLATLDGFRKFIRDPKMADGSRGDMPAFPADKLNDRQAADLFSYIGSMLPVWK